jgi:hypothetical protein
MNLFILYYGYHRCIIQQASGENVFTAGSYGQAAVMRSTSSPPAGVVQTGCDDGLSLLVGKIKQR